MQGDWIKVHRKIQDSRVFSDPQMFWVFMKCLLRANFKPGYFEGREIKVGQFAFSYRLLAEEMGCARNTLQKCLRTLQRWGMIRVESAQKFSVLTVINYTTYQVGGSPDEPEREPQQGRAVNHSVNHSVNRNVDTIEEEQEQQEEKEQEEAPASPPASPPPVASQELPKPKKSRDPAYNPEAARLPFASLQFRMLWIEWAQHRQEIKKPLKDTSAEKQLKMLARIGEDRAAAMIEHTIAMGWQGLREPEQPRAGPSGFDQPQQRTQSPLPSVEELESDD